MATFDHFADLPIEVEGYELEGLELQVPGFDRLSTVIRMKGGGCEGIGEDVTYEALDHVALQDAGPVHDLSGHGTLGELCEHIGTLDLSPPAPEREVSRRYRRWAFESAALDLALRQAGQTLHAALGREARPVTFVGSLRLGEPPTLEPIEHRRERYPGLRFKLDPTSSWDAALVARLRDSGAVDSLD